MRTSVLALLIAFLLTPTPVAGDDYEAGQFGKWIRSQQDRLEKSDNTSEKLAVISEMKRAHKATEAAAAVLVSALNDRNRDVRLAAARALVAFGPSAAGKIESILPFIDPHDPQSDDDQLSLELLSAIQQMGMAPYSPLGSLEHERVIPVLIRILNLKRAKLRARAVSALAAAGPYAKESVPALIRALDDTGDGDKEDEKSVRFGAYKALARIGPSSAPAVPVLLRLLKSRPEDTGRVIIALGGIGPGHPDVVPTLIALMNTCPILRERSFAAFHLGQIGPGAKDATAHLVKILVQNEPDSDPKTITWQRYLILKLHHKMLQSHAVHALGFIGPSAKTAVPILTKYAAGHNVPDQLRKAALEALRRLGPAAAEAVPDLMLLLKPTSGLEVDPVLIAIGKAAVPALVEMLKRGNEEQVQRTLWILARIGPDALAARPAISVLEFDAKHGETARQVLRQLNRFDRR